MPVPVTIEGQKMFIDVKGVELDDGGTRFTGEKQTKDGKISFEAIRDVNGEFFTMTKHLFIKR